MTGDWQTGRAARNDQFRSPASHQFSGTSIWRLLELRATTSGSRPFLTWHPFEGEGRAWTYAEFARDAASLAAGLSARGVRAGDPVLVHLENCPEFLLTWFACAAIGAMAVTTNTRAAGDELRYFADHSGPVGAVTQPRFAELVSKNAPSLAWQVCLDHDSGAPAPAGPDEATSFASLAADPDTLIPSAPDPWAPMSVQYTSGTTSRPKGVLWTHANALWAARMNASHEDLHPDDCHLVYAPLFHANALVFSVLPSLWVGAHVVLIPKWSTSRFWDISMRYRPTWLSLVGPAMRTLMTSEPPWDHSYRMFGAGICDPPYDAAYGTKTIGWWGMTETLGGGIVGDPYVPNRPMSMGRPSPEYGIAVVNDDGTPVAPEETGHLLVKGTRGLSLFAEYLHDPKATAESFDADGWFRTGDLVTPHGDGYISFADRSKDMLKVGGENVAASEVERVIAGVAGVAETAVVGRADDWLDEVPVAFVVATGPAEGLAERVRAACAELLADFKVPRDVYVVADMPRSTLAKVNKVELRKVADPAADRASAAERWVAEAKLDPSGDAV